MKYQMTSWTGYLVTRFLALAWLANADNQTNKAVTSDLLL